MTCHVAVTFEYENRPPDTVRLSDLVALQPQTIAARAIRLARKTAKPVNWTSLVVVVERVDAKKE